VSFLLVRVDDRLLHGQVVFGWGGALRPGAYLIVDDRVAADAWERGLFEAAAPAGCRVEVRATEEFASGWQAWPEARRTIVLIGELAGLSRLCRGGFRPVGGIALGGLHARPGTVEVLRYLHLTLPEIADLIGLLDAGCELYAQDLPTARRHGPGALRALLAGAMASR